MDVKRARLISGIFMLTACLLAVPASQSLSATALPVTHGSIVRDFARITFEWPDSVYFTATAQGKTVSVTFDRKANPDLNALVAQMQPYIKRAVRKPDGKTIVLTLDKPYRIRTFVSDNINGIDLLEVDTKAQRKVVAAKPAKPADPAFNPLTLAGLSPSAGEPAPAPVAEAPKPEQPAAAPAPAEPKAAEIPTPPPAEPAKQEDVPPVSVPVVSAPAVGEVPIPPTPTEDAIKPGQVKIGLSASIDSAVLRFPLPERAAMAVFVRNHKLWVVINKALAVDIADFTPLPNTVVGKPDIIPAEHATIIRMPVEEGVYPSATKETNSFSWAILLTNKKRPLANALKADVNTDPPAPAHVFIPVLEMAEPITVADPQVGDQVVITPLYSPSEGIAAYRDFIEFVLLETAQGIAVQKKADDVAVAQLRNGLRISIPQGATLTPGLPVVEQSRNPEMLIDVATLFPHDQWKPENAEDMSPQMQGLFHRIVAASEIEEATQARLKMAQIYLGQGMAVEALGQLDGIRRTNAAFYRSAKLNAMRGAANFLMYRFADAARDFAAAELNNNKEIDFWRSLIADLLGHPNQNYDFLALNTDYISKYPPNLRQRLVVVAADRSIADKEYNNALKIFDTVSEPALMQPISDYVNFLMASISASTGQEQEAQEMWDKLAENYNQEFVRASAEFARIVWGMGHGSLSKDEAVDRLERLRLAWHGDRLELQVMTLLGNVYEERKDYVNAMRIWHGGILSFPNSSIAIEMTRKMQDAFIIMFSEGGADKLPALDVLAMYYEYRNYAPSGSTGNEMMERLADRLISVDLLGQAAELLDRQMRFQTEKEQRSRIGASLATIHLMNHQPQRALQALQDSLYGENSLMLRLWRNRLAAQAMLEEGSSDKALQILGQDTSVDAQSIRLAVYWREKDWKKVISNVEEILKTREDIAAPVTLDESESLLKLALAYIFENNFVQLQYLRDYFGPLMENNPYKPVFDFVTDSEMVVTTTNFDEVVKQLSGTRSFIENYRARIQTAGLAAAVPKDANAAAAPTP